VAEILKKVSGQVTSFWTGLSKKKKIGFVVLMSLIIKHNRFFCRFLSKSVCRMKPLEKRKGIGFIRVVINFTV
jgi:hypothetical protein